MKLLYLLSALLAFTPFISACLHVYGSYQTWTTGTKFRQIGKTVALENDTVVCDSAWGTRQDQDAHLSITCLPGYIMALSYETMWFRSGVKTYKLDLKPWNITDANCKAPGCTYLGFDPWFLEDGSTATKPCGPGSV